MSKLEKIVKALLFFLLLAAGALFLFAIFHDNSQEEPHIGRFYAQEIATGWTLVQPDGTAETVRLPVTLRQETGHTLVLRGRMPADVREGMHLCIRAVREDLTVRIGGTERGRYYALSPSGGNPSPVSAYLLVDLRDADANAPLEIEILPYASESVQFPAVTYAYGNNVWFPHIAAGLPLVVTAIILILFGLLVICGYFALRRKMGSLLAALRLAETAVATGMWILSESDIRQLFFRAPSYSSIFSFVLVEIMCAFLMMYFDEIQEHRYKTVYLILSSGLLFQFIVNSVLAFLRVASYYDTVRFSHIWSGAALLFGVVSLIEDVRKRRILRYSITAIGMLLLLVFSVLELLNFFLRFTGAFGVYLGVGLIMLLSATLMQAVSDELTLIRQRQASDNADRAKSAFLANMSHEIRTPINAILGMDEIILRESSEREVRSYAQDIQNAGKTLLSLINDILDFSKVEEGKMEILPTQYDLSAAINDIVNMIRPRAEEKGLSFHVSVDGETPQMLYGDEIRIRQCALNLLTNAVKYTERGSVTFSVGFEKLTDDKISLRLRVSDTGIGLKPEDMDKLFQPFSRIEESRNRSIEGTGLGMSITRQLLDLMGSDLEVESVYDEGSTFSFALEQPVVKWTPIGEFKGRFETDRAHGAVYRESFRAPDARVLVVDDMPVNLTVIRGLLKKTQITVDTAESGPEAIEKASRQCYDVIFIDHMMPGMDGIETLAELQKLPDQEHTAFIALTANAISGARELYFDAGFSDYLPKPVDSKALEEMLITHLPPEKISSAEQPAEAADPVDNTAVLVVTGDARICELVIRLMRKNYHVEACQSAAAATAHAARLKPALILLDVRVGDISGFVTLRALKRDGATHDIPVVLMLDEESVDVETIGFRNGAADFIRKDYLSDALLRRAKRIIQLNRLQNDLQNEVKRQIRRTERLSKEMMITLSRTVDAKDHFTSGHSVRVATYAAEIARRMGRSGKEQERIYSMGLMHDIGKISLSEELLNQTEALSDEEMAHIRRHTVVGDEILRSITEMPELAKAARWHHEWFNGEGYPDGLKGDDIPEFARILCVADSYDAMTSTRVYSPPRAQAEVRAEIERCSGTQFDPVIAKVMLRMIDEDVNYRMSERMADISIWKTSSQFWSVNGTPETDAPAETADGAEHAADAGTFLLPDWLYDVEELDVPLGMRFCGTEDVYLDTLTIYAKNVSPFAQEIENCYAAGDVVNTTVKVHALKSTSLAVGAAGLSELAKTLELAGKAGDTRTLDAELGGLLARYRALGKRLAPITETEHPADESLPPISDKQLRETYSMIRSLLDEFEYDRAAGLIDSLCSYRLADGDRERCESMKRAAENFDWDEIGGLLP